jgi:hypothetical protein
MGYLTLKIRNPGGDLLFETDVTLHEFIPFVRQMTRSLASHPDLAANPTGYRALLKPCYDLRPKNRPVAEPPREAVTPAPPLPAQEGSLLQISEEDLETYAPVTYFEELSAFYHPGSSSLCLSCPERRRCPGSGRAGTTDLSGWIELDPEAPRTNEPVKYFTLRIEALGGKVLRESELRLQKLESFVALVSQLLRETGRLTRPATGTNRGEFIARFEGQPRVDPLLSPSDRPPAYFSRPSVQPKPASEPPRRLVDWDRLEEPDPSARREPLGLQSSSSSEPDPVDLEIKVFPTETDPLTRRPPPPSELLRGAPTDPEQLPIFLHRSVFHDLNEQRSKVRSEVGGILVGEAFVDPVNGRSYVEVVAALPATDERGEWVKVNLDSHSLRQIQERIDREFPGRRTVGWYRFHLLRVAVRTAGSVLTADIYGEPLRLLEEEVFLHRNFFPQPWHLGLVIDTVEGALCFYHLRDGAIVTSGGFRLVG